MNGSTTVLRVVAVASVAVAMAGAIHGWPGPTITPTRPLPPCVAEDGGPIPCVWDGPNRDNHLGDRVVITETP